MDPFLSSVLSLLNAALAEAGAPALAEQDSHLIEQPPDPRLGDFAFPCFALAKTLRKAPPLIAQDLARRMQAGLVGQPLLTGVEAVGPYVNVRASLPAMAAQDIPALLNGTYFGRNRRAGRPKVMIEFSQPNTHKAFHVGHMRNVALGDALVRIFRTNGHEVIAANYIGDVGTHIAKCLWFIQRNKMVLPDAQATAEERGEWLGDQYTAATLQLENAAKADIPGIDPELVDDLPPGSKAKFDSEVSAVLQQLESGEGPQHALWQETRQWSLDAFEEIYRWLGVRFDQVFYESEMTLGRQIVEDGLKRGVFQRSQGAVGIDLEPYKLGFLLVLKADGTTLYATKDLALATIKFKDFGIDESIYVVGAEQTLHFQQVFKTLELLGWPQAAQCHHLSYGLVVLPEGKMSSRAGNVIAFSKLRADMDRYILTNYLAAHRGDWPEDEIAETARRIAVAAIRYGMVKQDPSRTIVFKLDDWLVSEGDTGTYLCYAYTRIQSVLRNAGREADAGADFSLLTQDTEQRLIRHLHEFNRVVQQAGRLLRPNLVANALFQLCKDFSRTYVTSPVLQAENAALGEARLALFAATGRLLEHGLELIGIAPPGRM